MRSPWGGCTTFEPLPRTSRTSLVAIVADEWCNRIADTSTAFSTFGAADLIQDKMLDLGPISNAVAPCAPFPRRERYRMFIGGSCSGPT